MTSLLNYSHQGRTPAPISVVGCGSETAWTEVGVIATPVIDLQTDTICILTETTSVPSLCTACRRWTITTGAEKLAPEFERCLIEEAAREERSVTNYVEVTLSNVWDKKKTTFRGQKRNRSVAVDLFVRRFTKQ